MHAQHVSLEEVAHQVSDQELLLILDNCEHVLDAAAAVAEYVLSRCGQLRILATSRESLNVAGEVVRRVPPLTSSEASQLFADRAWLVRPELTLTHSNGALINQVCKQLDGMPLAIELAASRLKVLSLEQLTAQLDDQLTLLVNGRRVAQPRHQTLRSLIDWSYGLLSNGERAVLRRVSAFAGGFTLDAAEQVCSNVNPTTNTAKVSSIVLQLVDKSLVVAHDDAPSARYRLLETIRQYAYDKLIETGEECETRLAHLRHFATHAARGARYYNREDVRPGWKEPLDTNFDNLIIANNWASQNPYHFREAEESILGIFWYWFIRAYWEPWIIWVKNLFVSNPDVDLHAKAKALWGIGNIRLYQGQLDEARIVLEASVALCRQIQDSFLLAYVSATYSWVLDTHQAIKMLQTTLETIESSYGQVSHQSLVLLALGAHWAVLGDHEKAVILITQAMTLADAAEDRGTVSGALYELGVLAMRNNQLLLASDHFTHSADKARLIDDYVALSKALLCAHIVAAKMGDIPHTLQILEEIVELQGYIGSGAQLRAHLLIVAHMAIKNNDYIHAIHLVSVAHRENIDLISLEDLGFDVEQMQIDRLRCLVSEYAFTNEWRRPAHASRGRGRPSDDFFG